MDKNGNSQDSGIRIGGGSGASDKSPKQRKSYKEQKRIKKFDSESKLDINEMDDLDEIMNNEMIKDQVNQDSAVKLDSNGGNQTTDLETNNERPSVISSKPMGLKGSVKKAD